MISILLVASDFGVIAFCGTIFLVLYFFGLREKFSNEETASAYSVFNKDGKAIVGGLTAEQFDRQLRGTPRTSERDPVKGSVAIAIKSSDNASSVQVSDQERLRRRQAAASAAERRSNAGSSPM